MSDLEQGIVVYKMTGSGNDFVFLDGRGADGDGWTPERISAICDRRRGVGADGLVIIGPGSKKGHVKFTFYNSDGSEAPMCGNGALCATRLAAHLGISLSKSMHLETGAGTYETDVCGHDSARIKLEDATSDSVPDVELRPGERSISFLRIGVPHVVVVVDDVDEVNLDDRGAEIRYHSGVPEGGANVNFVSCKDGVWSMRTYERGVEGETEACGTGATSCAAVLAHQGLATLPWSVRTRSGEILRIEGEVDQSCGRVNIKSPKLTGQAKIVFRGITYA